MSFLSLESLSIKDNENFHTQNRPCPKRKSRDKSNGYQSWKQNLTEGGRPFHHFRPFNIIKASFDGDDQVMKIVLQNPVLQNLFNGDEYLKKTILEKAYRIAIKEKKIKVVELFLENPGLIKFNKKRRITLFSTEFTTPLNDSIENGSCKIVKLLVENDINANTLPGEKSSLKATVNFNRPKIAQLLLNHPKSNLSATATDLDHALLKVSTKGFSESSCFFASTLIDHGANPNFCFRKVYTPLILAEKLEHDQLVAYLKNHGAVHHKDLAIQNKSLLKAAENPQMSREELEKIFDQLQTDQNLKPSLYYRDSDNLNAFILAIRAKNFKFLEVFVRKIIDNPSSGINSLDQLRLVRMTALSTAVFLKRLPVISWLIANGADPANINIKMGGEPLIKFPTREELRPIVDSISAGKLQRARILGIILDKKFPNLKIDFSDIIRMIISLELG